MTTGGVGSPERPPGSCSARPLAGTPRLLRAPQGTVPGTQQGSLGVCERKEEGQAPVAKGQVGRAVHVGGEGRGEEGNLGPDSPRMVACSGPWGLWRGRNHSPYSWEDGVSWVRREGGPLHLSPLPTTARPGSACPQPCPSRGAWVLPACAWGALPGLFWKLLNKTRLASGADVILRRRGWVSAISGVPGHPHLRLHRSYHLCVVMTGATSTCPSCRRGLTRVTSLPCLNAPVLLR